MRNAFVDTVIGACSDRQDVFICSGDAGLGVFDSFQVEHADRFLNLGVAEQNAIGFSAGLSMAGFKVFVYNIIPFVLYRCYEQVRNDICYQRLPVVLAGTGSGVAYAPAGMTHYAVEDLGVARTLPNLTVFSPMDPVEARLAARYALTAEEPVYVRLAKRGEPTLHADEHFDITEPQVIQEGQRVALVFHGSIGPEAVEAARLLAADGIHPCLVSVAMVQPLRTERLWNLLRDVEIVVCVEEHFIASGLGGILAGEVARRRPAWRLERLGIPDRFIHQIRHTAGMREEFGISAGCIAGCVKAGLRQ